MGGFERVWFDRDGMSAWGATEIGAGWRCSDDGTRDNRRRAAVVVMFYTPWISCSVVEVTL